MEKRGKEKLADCRLLLLSHLSHLMCSSNTLFLRATSSLQAVQKNFLADTTNFSSGNSLTLLFWGYTTLGSCAVFGVLCLCLCRCLVRSFCATFLFRFAAAAGACFSTESNEHTGVGPVTTAAAAVVAIVVVVISVSDSSAEETGDPSSDEDSNSMEIEASIASVEHEQ